MNLLILGSGGREHALAWKLLQSKKIDRLFIAPGNAGTAALGANINIDPCSFAEVKQAVMENNISMVLWGLKLLWLKAFTTFFLPMTT